MLDYRNTGDHRVGIALTLRGITFELYVVFVTYARQFHYVGQIKLLFLLFRFFLRRTATVYRKEKEENQYAEKGETMTEKIHL